VSIAATAIAHDDTAFGQVVEGLRDRYPGEDAVNPFVDPALTVLGSRREEFVPIVLCPVAPEPLPKDNATMTTTTPAKIDFVGPDVTIRNGGVLILRAGGRYVFGNLDLKNGGEIAIDNANPVAGASSGDPVELYVWNDLSAAGKFVQGSNRMRLIGLNGNPGSPQEFDISGNSETYVNVYAPCADVKLSGAANFYGRIYAWTVDVQASST